MKRTHAFAVAVLLALTAGLIVDGLRHSGSSIHEHFHVLGIALGGFACALIAFFSILICHLCGWRISRNYSALVLLCGLAVAFLPMKFAESRRMHTIQQLEATYDGLAKNGPPFPARDDARFAALTNDQRMVSHGYWCSADGQNFEIYYHLSSDSYALAYPERKWVWRDYAYSGPENATAPVK